MKKMEVAIATPRVKKLSNGHNTNVKTLPDINSRTFTTRLTPRYLTIPQLPKGLPEPKFSESAEKILRERYLLKGGNLEVAETIAERFWHVSYDLASAGFDFKEKENAVYQKAIKFYQMMVSQEFMPNSPTVMNAGKQNGLQYSACFVLPIEDSLPDIFDTMKNAALIHQSGGGCISADARVWTTFCGIEPIEVLFARATADGRKGIKQGFGEAFDVSDLGIKTASMNPQTGETGLKAVSRVWKYNVPAKQQVVVTTVEGTEIQTSSWHPFMILRGTKIMEISAEQLISGDIVLGPSNPDQYWPWNKQKTVGSLEITPELGWLIGFTLSDGSFGYVPALRQYRVRWFSGISDVLERVQKILSSHNIKVSIQKDRRGLLSVSTLNQRFVHDLLEACGLEKFGPKDSLIRIPEIVAKSPLKIIRAFLAGLLDGDGYVALDGSPSYSTVSQVMSEDLAALVSLLGFSPSISVKNPRGKGKKITYTVQLCPLPQVNKLAEQILPFVNSNLRKDRLKSLSKKGTALPLDFHAWRDCLAGLKLVNTRGDKKNGSGLFAKELNNWAAHGRINREDIQTIANGLRKSDLKLSQFLYQVAISGHEVKKVVTATTEKTYYDLSVEEWNTYAAGQSGMLMVHNTGFSFSKIRPNGSRVKRSGGVASGPVSFLKVYNSATESIKQGGTRRGANMGILRVNHPDILEFIRCKSELDYTNQPVFNAIAPILPDDEARAAFKTMLLDGQISNFNISVAITDQFMEAYEKGEKYDLINPYNGEVTGQLDAREVFNEIIDRAWQTGDPGVVFIDRINNTPSNPVRELETIEATNPCGEQPLAPWDSCNLGSINLGRFIKEDKEVDWDKLRETTHLAVELLDDVVQVNPFNLEPIYDQVHLNRRIGLGVMGWSDMLFKMKTPYDCEEALALAEEVMGFVNREGHLASQKLAQERGAFPNWPFSIYKDDKPLRNATISTIAPTGTISIISDCSSGVEPVFALAYLHKAKGVGDQVRTLTIANQTFSEIAQKEGFYSESLAQKVMDHGSVYGIEEVPTDWQKVFVTASEIGYPWHVKMQAAFQKYTDNGVSKTVNLSNSASKDDIKSAYLLAWETGCKGITVYRDGSKSIQVLNISSSLKPKETSTEVIGVSEVENNKLVDSRPVVLRGRTYKMATPVGEAFVTVNRDEKNEPFEIFITIGKAGMHTAADAEAIGRMISLALRISRGNRREIAQKIVSHLGGIGGSSQIGFGKNRVMSLADAISKALAEELAQIEGSGESIPLNLTITDSAVLQLQLEPTVALREKSGKIADFCPECGQATFIFEEGCKKCHSCGYSAC